MCAWHFSLFRDYQSEQQILRNVIWEQAVWYLLPGGWRKARQLLKSSIFKELGILFFDGEKASKMVPCPIQHLRGRDGELVMSPNGKASILGPLGVYPIMLGNSDSMKRRFQIELRSLNNSWIAPLGGCASSPPRKKNAAQVSDMSTFFFFFLIITGSLLCSGFL